MFCNFVAHYFSGFEVDYYPICLKTQQQQQQQQQDNEDFSTATYHNVSILKNDHFSRRNFIHLYQANARIIHFFLFRNHFTSNHIFINFLPPNRNICGKFPNSAPQRIRHNYVYLYLTEFQSQNPFRFNYQSVKVITFSL